MQEIIERIANNDPDFRNVEVPFFIIPTPEDIIALANALVNSISVIELGIYSSIDSDGVIAIVEALKTNTSIKTLTLHSIPFDKNSINALANMLKVNRSITELDIIIDSYGAIAIGEALKINTSIKTLTLMDSEIGDIGINALANMLKVNNSLENLDLTMTQIGNMGVKSLANMLKVNKSLNSLYLTNNPIGDEGLKYLANSLKVNTSLKSLICEEIEATDDGFRALGDALKVNKTLTNVHLLNEENIPESTMQIFTESMSENGMITYFYPYNELIRSYELRNRMAHSRASTAALEILKIANIPPENLKDFFDRPESLEEHHVFDRLLKNTGHNQRKAYLIEMAKHIWESRWEPVWWTPEERRAVGLEERPEKRAKIGQVCISGAICTQPPRFMESHDARRVFCSAYCQWMHYSGGVDLRGMTPAQIQKVLV